jgi:pyruvate formate lyase activating enzyme
MTADEILEVVERDRAFYGKEGGITLSGGEPFMQGEKTLSLLREAKRRGLNVAVETCGAADKDILKAAVPLVDIFLYDVKDTDGARHKRYTGASFSVIAENLKLIDSLGAKTRLRCILLKGINTDPCHYKAIADLAKELLGCEGVELLPYHPYGASKAAALGLGDNGNKEWIPTEEDISFAKERIGALGITVYG